jgi:hypothetical protein
LPVGQFFERYSVENAKAGAMIADCCHCEERNEEASIPLRGTMDCFAGPVIGRRFAPTRWLAMTVLSPVIPGLRQVAHPGMTRYAKWRIPDVQLHIGE